MAKHYIKDEFKIVSVLEYGADGSGSGDSTPLIQSAIDDVYNMGGGTVFIPNGLYHVGKLIIKSGVTIKGNKYNSSNNTGTILAPTGETVISTDGLLCEYAGIEDLLIMGNASVLRGLDLFTFNNSSVNNVVIKDCIDNVYIKKSKNTIFESVQSVRGGTGFNINGGLVWQEANNILTFIRCEALDNGKYGAHVTGFGSGCSFIGSSIISSGDIGILVDTYIHNLSLISCIIAGNDKDATVNPTQIKVDSDFGGVLTLVGGQIQARSNGYGIHYRGNSLSSNGTTYLWDLSGNPPTSHIKTITGRANINAEFVDGNATLNFDLFESNMDFHKIKTLNFLLENSSKYNLPTDPKPGQIIFDNTDNTIMWHDGLKWNSTSIVLSGPSIQRPVGDNIGRLFYDTDLNKLIINNGTGWDEIETSDGVFDIAYDVADQAYEDAAVYIDNAIFDLTQYVNSKNNFNDGIIIGNYKISVNQTNGNLEITLVNP